MKLYERENGTWYVDYFIKGKRCRTFLKTKKKVIAEPIEKINGNYLKQI
jgi:hypothetical protein